MAITFSRQENYSYNTDGQDNCRSTWDINYSADNFRITNNSFKVPDFDCSAQYSAYSGKNSAVININTRVKVGGNIVARDTFRYDGTKAGGSYTTIPRTSTTHDIITTSDIFNSTNPTELTVPVLLYSYRTLCASTAGYDGGGGYKPPFGYISNMDYTEILLGTYYATLDVPPTCTVSAMSYDTGYVYAGLTTASVTISDAAAYYDGTISSIVLTIGNQTDTISGNGTLSIALANAGTFTPTVTITDSRGQTKTYSLDPITVNTYTAPTVSFDVDRTDSTGTPDDEGTYGLIEATLTFSDAVADAVAPSVVLTDENGTQTTPTVTWYTDNTLQTTVTWANVSSGDTVYGLFSGLNTNYSYSVSVRPRDTQGTGTAISQTVSSAFYTVDFLAGGHGIAFGKPAANVGFECAMDATFEDDLIAQDMSAQEVSDFINALSIGTGVTIDQVIEEGTINNGLLGTNFYRKWSSGKAEFWYAQTFADGMNTAVWSSPIYYADKSLWTSVWDGVFNTAPIYLHTTSTNSQIISIMPTAWDASGITNLRFVSVTQKSNTAYGVSLYAVGTWQ